MIASTNPVCKFLLAASPGAALVCFASMASALPVYSALTLVNAAPSVVEDVQWRVRRVGWRNGRGWRARWGGWHRTYPISRSYYPPMYLYPCRSFGRSWPDQLGCW